MKQTVAVVILSLFALTWAFVVIGGIYVLFTERADTTPDAVPFAPEIPLPPPLATDTALATQQVSAYEHEASAYTQRVTAYGKYVETWANQRARGADRASRYQAIVKDALLPLLNPLVAAFIAYAFAKAGANAVRNVMAARNHSASLTDLDL